MRVLIAAFALLPALIFAQATLDLARAAQRSGNVIQAEALYKQAIAEAPDSFDANFEYGMLLLRTQRSGQAIKFFDNAIAIDPTRHEPYIAQANALLESNQLPAALDTLSRGETACKSLPEYWVMRGGVEAALLKKTEAALSLNMARAAGSSRADIAYQVGITFLSSLKDPKSAESHLLFARDGDRENRNYEIAYIECLMQNRKDSQAADEIIALVRKDPGDRTALGFAVRIAASSSSLESGLSFAERTGSAGVAKSWVHVIYAAVYIARDKRDDALRSLDEALAENPTHIEALVRRSALRLELSNPEGAIADARVAVQTEPANSNCYRTLYFALEATGRKREAERAVRTWLALSRNDPTPYWILATKLRARESYAEAATLFELLAELTPDDPRPADESAACYILMGNAERAVEVVSKAIERGVKSSDLLLRLALAHRQQSEIARAQLALREMREKFPGDIRGWTLAAATYESGNRLREAVEVYKDLAEKHPDLPDGLDGMARCLAALGEHLEAARAWRTVGERFEAAIPALIAAGQQFIAAGMEVEAHKMWDVAMEKRGKDVQFLAGYAQFLVMAKKTDDALRIYQRMIAISKSNSQPYLASAELLMEKDRKDRAIEILESGLEHCYDDFKYIKSFAIMAAEANANIRFEAALERLIEQGLYSRHSITVWVDQKSRKGELTSAIKKLDQRARANPSNAALWYGLSRAHGLARNDLEALMALEKVVDLEPNDLELLRVFASASEASMDSGRSARAYERLVRLMPNDSANWLKAVAYYHQIGNAEKARDLVRQAAKLFPEDDEVTKALAKYGD